MNIQFKKLALISAIALASASSFAGLLADLQLQASTIDQASSSTSAVADVLKNLNAALNGAVLSVATDLDVAVILQNGADNFAYIGQDTSTGTTYGNYASIDQDLASAKGNAYIFQQGTTNFASITQASANGGVAYIAQTSSGNRGIISQK